MTTNLIVPSNLAADLAAALAAGHDAAELSSYLLLDAQYGVDSTAPIDFAALFPATECTASVDSRLDADFECEDVCCSALTLTPRQAYALHNEAASFMDFAASSEDPSGWYLDAVLPPVCAAFVGDPVWVTQLRHVFHVLAARIAAGEVPYPRSTAEEMALHIALDHAQAAVDDGLCADEPEYADLPVLSADLGTGGFDDIRDWAFEDHDVLMLFDARLDGVENSSIADDLGMANLHPRNWFTSFRAVDQVTATVVLPAAPVALVVRFEAFREYTITDPRALLAEAEELGWVADYYDDDDDASVLDALASTPAAEVAELCARAVLFLAGVVDDLPGAELGDNECTAFKAPAA